MNIFNSASRRRLIHGHRHHRSPFDLSLDDPRLASHSHEAICTSSFKTSFFVLIILETQVTNPNISMYRLSTIIMDIANHRLFKSISFNKDKPRKRSLLKFLFANKLLVKTSNILQHKSVKSKIPPYFQDKSLPIISYLYTPPIVTKIFNFKHPMKNLSINDYKSIPLDCDCAKSTFIYNPAGNVITGDLNIAEKDLYEMWLPKDQIYVRLNP